MYYIFILLSMLRIFNAFQYLSCEKISNSFFWKKIQNDYHTFYGMGNNNIKEMKINK